MHRGFHVTRQEIKFKASPEIYALCAVVSSVLPCRMKHLIRSMTAHVRVTHMHARCAPSSQGYSLHSRHEP